MSKLLFRLQTIGADAKDQHELVRQKQFLIYLAVFMSTGGLIWGVISLQYQLYFQSAFPLGYAVISMLNLWYFDLSKNFKIVRAIQVFISLVLPFLFQWFLGGFLSSGFIMLWALLSLIASLSFQRASSSVIWLVLFISLTAISAYFNNFSESLSNQKY